FMTHLRPERRATWTQRWPTPDPAPSKTEGVPELAGQEPAEQAGKREQIVGHEQSTHRDQNSSGGPADDATPAPDRPDQGDAAAGVAPRAKKQEGQAKRETVSGQQNRAVGGGAGGDPRPDGGPEGDPYTGGPAGGECDPKQEAAQ